MAATRQVCAAVGLVSLAILLAGCAAHGEPAATDRAREQFADMKEQFAANAPPAGIDDFVGYVRDASLDGRTGVVIDANGDPNPTDVGIGGQSSRMIYSAKVIDNEGVVGLIVMGHDSPAGWGARPATVYTCLTATFDLKEGGEPEYADADCIDQLRGSIATDTHKTLKDLGG